MQITKVLIGLIFLASFLFIIGYLGHMHPLLDAVSLGRRVAVYSALGLLFLMCLLKGYLAWSAMFAAAIVLGAGMHRLPPTGEDGPIRVYSKNLLYLNADPTPIVEDIRSVAPDVVVLQEVSPLNRQILIELASQWPHKFECPWQDWNAMAILSRWPMGDAGRMCSQDRALMRAKITHSSGSFWMIGVHLQHPWPDIQWPLLEASLPVLQNLDARMIVAGDFNTLHWSAAAQKVGAMTGTRPIRTKRPTHFLWGVGLHLDQVWALGGRAHVRPRLGSDHRGVLADVWY